MKVTPNTFAWDDNSYWYYNTRIIQFLVCAGIDPHMSDFLQAVEILLILL